VLSDDHSYPRKFHSNCIHWRGFTNGAIGMPGQLLLRGFPIWFRVQISVRNAQIGKICAPDWPPFIEWTFRSYEGRTRSGGYPNVSIRWLFSNQRRDSPSNATNLDFYIEIGSFACRS